jgi:pyruvate kinase
VIAKIEKPEAMDNIDAIIAAADGIMVARGDLGIEASPEEVPLMQKLIIKKCNEAGVPVITATQMLDSMMRNPRPTRAEASDVANAVFDGADAVMLSAETASGRHPARACATMARIIAEAEASQHYAPRPAEVGAATDEAIARAACDVAHRIRARGIVVFSASGATARLVSKARPDRPVIGVGLEETAVRRMALYWGVRPVRHEIGDDAEDLAARVRDQLKRAGLAAPGDRVVMVFGAPLGRPGSTNSIRVEAIP